MLTKQMNLPGLLWLNQLKLVRKLNEQNVFMERKSGFALNAVEMNYAKLMEKTSTLVRNVVEVVYVYMAKERHNAEIAVDHHIADMVKERRNAETAVDLLLVLILITNTNARYVPLLVFDTMFNVVLIAFCWIQTFEDLEISPGILFSISKTLVLSFYQQFNKILLSRNSVHHHAISSPITQSLRQQIHQTTFSFPK
jgi:hypothetical protein